MTPGNTVSILPCQRVSISPFLTASADTGISSFKDLHRLESKRTVHHLIQCNERNGKYCVTIILILK